jgi:hypothetical protein
MKSLTEQYNHIKQNKGSKDVFTKTAKSLFPQFIPSNSNYNQTLQILKYRGIISESIVGNILPPKTKESFELAFEKYLSEEAKKSSQENDNKIISKKTPKEVEDVISKTYNKNDKNNPNNYIFDQIMKGYYTEMCDSKNKDKTMDEIKSIVFKNLEKNPIYYTEESQFGIKDIGYTTETPGLSIPKEPKGKYKASGYGDLKENQSTRSVGPMVKPEGFQVGDKVKYKGMNHEVTRIVDDRIYIKNLKFGGRPDTWVKAVDLKKSLKETRGGGNYGMLTINTQSGGSGGRRFIPKFIALPKEVKKRFGDHILYNSSNQTLYISQILYNNIVKGYSDQPAIKKLIMDIPPMIKQILNKTENYNPPTGIPNKAYKIYMPHKAKVAIATQDSTNKEGTTKYWSVGDYIFPNTKTFNQDDLDGFGLSSNNDIEESVVRNFIKGEIKKILSENISKEIKTIRKEAQIGAIALEYKKIKEAIERRKAKMNKINEDEDLLEMADKKQIKKIEKELKILEKALDKTKKQIEDIKNKSESNPKPKKEKIPLSEMETKARRVQRVLAYRAKKYGSTPKDVDRNLLNKIYLFYIISIFISFYYISSKYIVSYAYNFRKFNTMCSFYYFYF